MEWLGFFIESFDAVAVDFDYTLVNKSICYDFLTPEKVQTDPSVVPYDPAWCASFFGLLLRKNIKVAVVSYGRKDVIEAFLKKFLPSIYPSVVVLTPAALGKVECASLDNKNSLLGLIDVVPSRLVLFDDDPGCVEAAREKGYEAFVVKRGFTRQYVSKLSLEEVPSPEPPTPMPRILREKFGPGVMVGFKEIELASGKRLLFTQNKWI